MNKCEHMFEDKLHSDWDDERGPGPSHYVSVCVLCGKVEESEDAFEMFEEESES